ncbi:uncharacterized protein LOC130391392 isoform X4 [Gadus chalcogrammus]|uniref:uncharacterized protein LOC130391392 isoform X4 n=1 Tax=Gadus chalcogrammus TaxID=1042646 RepID=UPI0024C4C11A|nr:uncharacterized protein LOC130391392 isoform X4 [Gadus chalcogrammus]
MSHLSCHSGSFPPVPVDLILVRMYSIVEFLGERTVGIVASNWIIKEGDVSTCEKPLCQSFQKFYASSAKLFCFPFQKTCSYWPLHKPTQRAKDKDLPDPKTWLKRPIKIFSSTDDWDQAVRRNKRAETKSCVETGNEDTGRRIIVKPQKFIHTGEKKTKKRNGKKAGQGPYFRTSLPPPPQIESPIPRRSALQISSPPVTDDDYSPPSPARDVFTENDDDSIASSFETPLPISTGDGDRRERETIPIWAKNINATLEVLLRRLETVEQNQREALLLLRANRHGDPGEASVELLQAQTQAELQELEEHLKNRDFTKKMISHLSLVGGSNPGECVRRVLRSVASNFVWSSYSLRGKKGKMPLLGTSVGSTIKQAIMKWKPGLEEKEVELLMAEVLKHAPSAHSKSLKVSLKERGICNRYPSR